MKATLTIHGTVFTSETERLMASWRSMLEALDQDAVGEAALEFVEVLSERIADGNSGIWTQLLETPGGRRLLVVHPAPFMELAMREVVGAVASQAPADRKVARIAEMTMLLLGEQ